MSKWAEEAVRVFREAVNIVATPKKPITPIVSILFVCLLNYIPLGGFFP